jgi:SAM-dependent methyltransferase
VIAETSGEDRARVNVMSVTANILERTLVYRAWQAPFAEQKFAPVLEKNDLRAARRVLDVACGPGTNTGHFADVDYLGIDINENYIRDARQKYGRDFMAVDARRLDNVSREPFDFILVNSFLHHLDNKDVFDVLWSLDSRLSADGHIHILELVLPENRSIARLLAHWDRGDFARPLPEWQTLFSKIFTQVLFQPYCISAKRAVLWNMVYFKGKSKR